MQGIKRTVRGVKERDESDRCSCYLYHLLEASTALVACCGLADQTSVPNGAQCLLLSSGITSILNLKDVKNKLYSVMSENKSI